MVELPGSLALFTDLYQLTMVQAYLEEDMHEQAVFSMFVRRLPEQRNYLIACGLDDALTVLENLELDDAALRYLGEQEPFRPEFIERMRGFRFAGDVYAVPEGTPIFANEPILEVVAPIAQAQLAESLLLNTVQIQMLLASKATRVVEAAQGRAVIDFGMRRMHGMDASLRGARAYHVAGLHATSNVAAGQVYGIPISGTMAHSYVQSHDEEYDAFREFARVYPETVLLVDTYDTLDGVRKTIRLAGELGESFRVRGVRLDSGDLAELARESRRLLDEAGLRDVKIIASGNLDEYKIDEMIRAGAPIDGFGVGTEMGVSSDRPSLDIVYKLVSYAGRGRMKLSSKKIVLPGQKQIFRREEDGQSLGDTIGRWGEKLPGRPLLQQVMEKGRRTDAGRVELNRARDRARREIDRLPDRVRALAPADPRYEVEVSEALEQATQDMRRRYEG